MCNIIIIHAFKNHLLILMMMVLLHLSFLFNVQGQNSDQQQNMPDLPQTVHPSKGLVISVLTIMFAITFLLLAYVKFCKISPIEAMNQNPNTNLQNFRGLTRTGSRFSGINREVIETLPFFKFSSLKGSKEGLECTVCLSKFEDSEILRLLPKCQHAFHMSCIDKWLESHSTCPLCRYRVEPGDIKNFNFSLSSRFLRVPSNLTEDPNVEIYVQREPSNRGSSRFSIGSGLWEVGKSKKQEQPLVDQEGDNISGGCGINTNTMWAQEHVHQHKLNHRIVISDVVTRSRWSDLNSSDLISLSFEMMLNDASSTRFSPDLEPNNNNNSNGERIHHGSSSSNNYDEEGNSFTALNNPSSEKRSMSEIANVPRFVAGIRKQSRVREYSSGGDSGGRDERLWRIWMPIAQRTVQWFARREIIRNSSHELQHKTLGSNVDDHLTHCNRT